MLDKLLQFIYNFLKKPHIVESGTTGVWAWEKWSDGTAKCWTTSRQRVVCSQAATPILGGYWNYGRPDWGGFPFTFKTPPIPIINGRLGLGIGFAFTIGTNESGIEGILGYSNQQEAAIEEISAIMIGNWK